MMNPNDSFKTWKNRLVVVLVLAALLGLKSLVSDPALFSQSYLLAYLFWFGLTYGALGFLLIHGVTGGKWGYRIGPILEAMIRPMPILALLFIPVLLGLKHVFPWTDTAWMQADHLLSHKIHFLNTPFFLIRTVIYFVAWIFITSVVLKARADERNNSNDDTKRTLHHKSAIALPFYVLLISFAGIDWVMSLDPHWYSSLFPGLLMVANALGALALALVLLSWIETQPNASEHDITKSSHDLGNLLFAFSMLWAYLGFSQYLIIWSANIPEEITWYQHRAHGGWHTITLLLIGFQFVLPFIFLLFKANKQNIQKLSRIAGLSFVMHFVDTVWIVVPNFTHGEFSFPFSFIIWPVAMGAAWLMMVLHYIQIENPSLRIQGSNQ